MSNVLKSKPIKLFLCLFMMLSLLAPCAAVSAAEAEEITPMAAVIDSYSCGITISGVTAKCNAWLGASYATTLRITMELQKENSSGYENVKTWTSSKYGVSMNVSESRAINLLSDYRLKVTFTAGNESRVAYAYPS